MPKQAPKPDQLPEWPADAVSRWPLDRLIPYARNARTHSDAQVAQIAASIREWGWTVPVLVDEDGGLIAGHGRIMAARQLGYTEAPVMVARGWSEAKKRAYIIADNKLAMNAGWDDALLRAEIADLNELGADLSLLGFSDTELAALSADPNPGHTDPDDVPEPPPEPVTLLGDVWLLGRHRLVCGDATTVEAADAALAGVKPHLMVTDPPYGVEYDADWRNKAMRSDGTAISGRAIGKVENDDQADWTEAWDLFPGDVAYVWHAGLHAGTVAQSLEAAGFKLRSQIVWSKSNFAIGRGDYHWKHEPCWYAVRKNATGHWAADRKQTTVWEIAKPAKSETGHSTQKPVECMQRPIENNSSPGQAVYEPFSGSGTTIIACERSGRACHAIELNPAYVDVAIQRWEAYAAGKATLEGDGRTYEELKAERCGG